MWTAAFPYYPQRFKDLYVKVLLLILENRIIMPMYPSNQSVQSIRLHPKTNVWVIRERVRSREAPNEEKNETRKETDRNAIQDSRVASRRLPFECSSVTSNILNIHIKFIYIILSYECHFRNRSTKMVKGSRNG